MPTYREGAVGKVAPMKEIAYLPKSQRVLKENDGLEKKLIWFLLITLHPAD